MKKLLLLSSLLFLLATAVQAQTVPSYVPSNGLVGWWPFNGNANDESGNGFNLTNYGASLSNDRNGNSNSAYTFNGTTTYMATSVNSSFYLANNRTVSAWVKGINTSGDVGIAGCIQNSGAWAGHGGYMLLRRGPGQNYAFAALEDSAYNGNSLNYAVLPSNAGSTSGSWHHLVQVRANNVTTLYVDGVLQNGTITKTPYFSNSLFLVGSSGSGGSNQIFNGQIDDIGVWNRALTQQEITALYNSQTCNSSSNTITADGLTTFCAGNSVNLISDLVGGTYQWKKNGVNITTNGTAKTYKASSTGSYTCVATCNGTALTSNAIAVTSKTNASATVSASGATSFCAGDSVTLNCTNLGSNYSVQWYRTNVSIENAIAYTQVVKQPGTYKVVTKNLTNGCSRISGSSAVVAVSCRLANPDVITNDLISTDFDAKVAGGDTKGKIYIYPNPTSDNKFTVELMGLEVDGNATLEVYNAMGQLLSSEKVNITNGSLNRTIHIDEQSKGQLCLVRLMAGSEVYDSKVILK